MVFGNMLVILAVFREKTLQTVTNMLIVSLAVSDFLVALCVMPFAVYFELNSFVWGLGQFLCNLYMATDVACSTASILNLLAISLDSGARASVFISVVWVVSVTVALPILLGVNRFLFMSAIRSKKFSSSKFSYFDDLIIRDRYFNHWHHTTRRSQ
uniref:G-protein coupled receptors family 1 profile domain-containing protein n=1 Tax=Parascaris equorum TaxID=6256 RepID=A0A914R4K1_PAREQ